MATERRYDIDWLRVFATYLLFPFHLCKVFDVPPYYHIKNADLSWGLAYISMFIHQWHMPLFFLLAGWSLHTSMAHRGTGAVLRERVQRILVPFLFGCCTLCIGLGYVEKDLMAGKGLSFAAYVPKFFTSLEYFTWGHLWFLIYLFTFTLLYMRFFTKLKRTAPWTEPITTGNLYRPLIPLIFMQLILRIWWPGMQNLYDDWGNFAYYSSFFILGFLMAHQPQIEEAIRREWKRAAKIGVPAGILLCIGLAVRLAAPHVYANDVVWHFYYYIVGAITGYCLLIAMLGFARERLCFGNRALNYLAESALPVYILHQGGIVFPGYFIIHLSWGIPAKFTALLLVSFVVTMAAYHFLVRPFNVLRIPFGMKRLRA